MKDDILNECEQFCDHWQEITMSYSDYARSIGINYTSLQVLRYIKIIDNCTQKKICELSFLPKQTVNTIITGFCKKGLVELKELLEDRRTKGIYLTNKGQEYVNSFFPSINNAEYEAMKSLNDEQRKVLIESIKIYGEVFRKKLLNEK